MKTKAPKSGIPKPNYSMQTGGKGTKNMADQNIPKGPKPVMPTKSKAAKKPKGW